MPKHDPSLADIAALLADRYRIERELGAGGMSTVYLAHDVRHDRPVAIKILRPELAAAIGPERFLAEIKTTANLQHAHILGLIDSGRIDGTAFYVMPFVDGESLRQRLKLETQLPIAEAVRIAIEVARALDYAHRRGVIHRDIKPENILLHEGQPVVADFGIALAVTRSDNVSRMTESGFSLGTPQYMSPEQAVGERSLDARSDVYSLGCVLYEMLTGEPPFSGPSTQATIAKVVSVLPEPVTTLRPSTPANVAAATMTALNKIPADRFASAADFATALANPQYAGSPSPIGAASAEPRGFSVRPRDVVALGVIGVLAATAVAGWWPSTSETRGVVARFEIPVPDSIFSSQIALSRDGTRLVWSGQSGVYERFLDSLTIRRVRDAMQPGGTVRDFSPDGDTVLVTGRGGMALVPLHGGRARSLSSLGGRGGAWSSDGYVYFGFGGLGGGTRGVARVRADGGAVDTIATADAPIGEVVALPRGRGLLVTVTRNGVSELHVLDLRTKQLRKLGVAGSFAQFVEPGYVVFAEGTSIRAGRFDPDRLEFTQPPTSLFDVPSGGVNSLAANRDVLVYVPLPEQSGSSAIIHTAGGVVRQLANVPDTLRFTGFSLSPDAARLAMSGSLPFRNAGPGGPPVSNLYIYELAAGRLSRLASDDRDQSPSWLPNGRDISFVRVSTDTPTTSTLMRRPWDGSSHEAPILSRPGGGRGNALGAAAWLPDGLHAIIRASGKNIPGRPPQSDLMRLSLDAPAALDTVVAADYSESMPTVSPDGRLLAFTSDESGRNEVLIRPVAGGALRRVSLSGGTQPRFAHNGRELFYVNGDTLFSAEIHNGPELSAGQVRTVFLARNIGLGYAVLPGDTSFITAAVPPTGQVVVVTDFAAELARLLGKR